MKRFGQSQIPLSIKTTGAGEHHRQAPQEKGRSMGAPNVWIDATRGGKIEKIVLVLAAK